MANFIFSFSLKFYILIKSRDSLFGHKEPKEIESADGLLTRQWAVKLKGANNYRPLTEEEDKLFDSLIKMKFSNIEPRLIKAQALISDYCEKNNLSHKQYLQLINIADLDFFGAILKKFKESTGLTLAPATKHIFEENFNLNEDEINYKKLLMEIYEKEPIEQYSIK